MSKFTNIKTLQIHTALSNRLKQQQEAFEEREREFEMELQNLASYANNLLNKRDVEFNRVVEEHKRIRDKVGRPRKHISDQEKRQALRDAQKRFRQSKRTPQKKLLNELKIHINQLAVDDINLNGLIEYLNNLNLNPII